MGGWEGGRLVKKMVIRGDDLFIELLNEKI